MERHTNGFLWGAWVPVDHLSRDHLSHGVSVSGAACPMTVHFRGCLSQGPSVCSSPEFLHSYLILGSVCPGTVYPRGICPGAV